MQASRPRNMHTAAAIKQAKHYPCGKSSPEPNPKQRHRKPTGYHMTPPLLSYRSYKSYKSYKSYASVTPPQTAYHRRYQKSLACFCGNFLPEPNNPTAPQTHGVHRGAPTTVNHRFYCATPPQPSSCRHYPAATLAPRSAPRLRFKPPDFHFETAR